MKKSSRARKNGVQTNRLTMHRQAEKHIRREINYQESKNQKVFLKYRGESLQETGQNLSIIHIKTNESREEV